MKTLYKYSLAFSLFSPTQAFCQQPKQVSKRTPVVRHSPASTLPDTIAITGKILAVSPGYCGTFCWGGTIKIRLTKPVTGYDSRYAFVVTACLHDADTSRTVSVKASKLKQQEKECYYTSINNAINSRIEPLTEALPFYKLSEQETRKLEQDEFRRK